MLLNSRKIENLREKKFRRQSDFCNKIGITVKAYKNSLDRNDFKTSTLINIAKVLEVPISYFFDKEEENIYTSENDTYQINESNVTYQTKYKKLQKENKELKKEIRYLKEINELLKSNEKS